MHQIVPLGVMSRQLGTDNWMRAALQLDACDDNFGRGANLLWPCSEGDRVGLCETDSEAQSRLWTERKHDGWLSVRIIYRRSFGPQWGNDVTSLWTQSRNSCRRLNKTIGPSFHWCFEKRYHSLIISVPGKTLDRLIVADTSRSRIIRSLKTELRA